MPYLTPEIPRWTPQDEAAIAGAATAGLLVESHHLDLKSSISPGRAANRELARDLASFAIDGGTLLVGLAECDDGPPELVPVELAGLAERIEQVARTIPDPPIPVTCTSIPAGAQPGRGYLLIEIPATGVAPHMVDGAYMGRGDKTKVRLSDPEVLRLHHLRTRVGDDVAQLVDDYVARDPIPTEDSQQAHAFIVAAPVRPRPEMLLSARPNDSWQQLLHQLLDRGDRTPDDAGGYSPNLRSVSDFSLRSDGAALTYNLSQTREPERWNPERPPPEDVIELEVTEEGAVRVLSTRLGDDVRDGRGQVVFEDVLPHLTHRTVGIAAAISDLTGYLGPWMLGVAATRIAGKPARGEGRLNRSAVGNFATDQREYRRYTEASTVEICQTPGVVTNRLVGRYLRSIGFENSPRIRPLLQDDAD